MKRTSLANAIVELFNNFYTVYLKDDNNSEKPINCNVYINDICNYYNEIQEELDGKTHTDIIVKSYPIENSSGIDGLKNDLNDLSSDDLDVFLENLLDFIKAYELDIFTNIKQLEVGDIFEVENILEDRIKEIKQEYYKSRGFSDKESELLVQRDKFREELGDLFAHRAKSKGKTNPEDWLVEEIAKLKQAGYQFSKTWEKHREIEKNIVEEGNKFALEVLKSNENNPCISVVYDPLLNVYHYTKNYKKGEKKDYEKWAYGTDSNSIHPILKERLNTYEDDIANEKVTLPDNYDKKLASHSEVRGLDLALKKREAANYQVTQETIKELYVYNVYLPELNKYGRIVPFVRCLNCKRLTDGIITVNHG